MTITLGWGVYQYHCTGNLITAPAAGELAMDEAGSSNTLSSTDVYGSGSPNGETSDRHGQRRYVLHGAERYGEVPHNATINADDNNAGLGGVTYHWHGEI